MGIVEDDVDAESLDLWYPMGIPFCAIQGLGLAIVWHWRNWPNALGPALTGAQLGLCLGATVFSHQLAILPDHNIELFLINASGLTTAWTLGALVIGLLHQDRALNKLA